MSESSANPNNNSSEAQEALIKETRLPLTGWQQEVDRGLELGLEAADSIRDRSIPNFSRGELPHYAGINTFLKAPYVEDVRNVGQYDVAIVGVPHDSGTTYRPGTRFGPQGIRRISALYTPYNFELGDEPFGALDIQTKENMQQFLLDIWEKTACTVLMITHDIQEAAFLSQRIYVLSAQPGTIKQEFMVNLPKERNYQIKRQPIFHQQVDEIADLLRNI